MSDAAAARPAAPRTRLPLPINISDIDLGVVHCERREVFGGDGERVTRLHSAVGVFHYAKKLQKALMGSVWLASLCGPGPYFIRTDTLVAVKELRRDCIESGRSVDGIAVREDPLREIRVMRYLNDVTYLDFPGFHSIAKLLHVLQDDSHLYLVLEYYAGGDTFALLKSLGDDKLPEYRVRNYFAQLVDAVAYMHSGGLVHLDLSTENVMLDSLESLIPKVIDFGTTGCIPTLPGFPMGPGFVGKKQYAAPEILADSEYSGIKADVWSLGVVLFMMLFGAPPFAHATTACKVYAAIVRHGLPVLLQHWGLAETVSAHALDLVLRMLTVNPDDRPTLSDVQSHPWFTAV